MSALKDDTRGDELYRDALVWDSHACLPLAPGRPMTPLARHRAAGADFVSVNIGMDMNPLSQVMGVIAGFRAWLAENAGEYLLAGSVEDVEQARRSGRLAVAFDIEGACMLQGEVDMLRLYRDLGVRQMHLAYNRNNELAGGCHDTDMPLTPLGIEVVAEANRLGVVMDCSHTGLVSSMDILERSTRPVVFSHSNVRALREHARNIRDEQIDACAATGGVIGVCGIGAFLGAHDISTETLVRHVDYIAERVGARHVGLGLDYSFDREHDPLPPGVEPGDWWPAGHGYGASGAGMVEPERLPAIARALLACGYARNDVLGILGGNFMRVARECWPRPGPAGTD